MDLELRLFQSLHPDPHDPSDKRPKLERARSAAEKENQPLQRTGSGLRRQYSHDSSVDMLNPAQRRMQQQIQASNSPHFQQSSLYGTNHQQPTHQQPSDIYSADDDPKYYQVCKIALNCNCICIGKKAADAPENVRRKKNDIVIDRDRERINSNSI